MTVADRELLDSRLERFAMRNRAALGRSDGAETARDRARIEVGIRLLGRHALEAAFDPHLAAQRVPVEHQRRVGIGGELAALPALVSAEEREAARIGAL